jgi:nicotinate-nucleotide adenylyltransferase
MPILCFGGSFNPIHNGHLICAQAVALKGGNDRLRLIPNAQPPHKPLATDIAPAHHRLAMCELAAQWVNASTPTAIFEVDDIETRRGGSSFTIDTAAQLKREGIDPIHWLIGADMLLYLPKWHRAMELLREVNFVIMARPGFAIDWNTLPEEFRRLRANVVEAPLVEISATDIRHRVRRGEPIDHLTPPPVARYIDQQQLYRG